MKNKYIFLFMLLGVITFFGCDKDEKSDSTIEYFPIITDGNGEAIVDKFIEKGDDFSLTYKAVYGNGTDITNKLVVEILDGEGNKVDNISTATSGLYKVTYSAKSSSELSSWEKKQVIIVYDPDSKVDISGTYIVDLDKTLSQDVGGRFEPKDDKSKYIPLKNYIGFFATTGPVEISLSKIYPGVYKISDAYFGWYDIVRGYGSKYRAPAFISLSADNVIQLLSAEMPSEFGGALDPFTAQYDPQTQSISFAYNFIGSVDIKDGLATLKTNPVVEISYTIVYNPNNNLGNPIEQEVKVGESVNMTKNTFEYEGYEFVGWNTKPDGSGVSYEDEAEILDWATVEGAVFTLYAQWKEKN